MTNDGKNGNPTNRELQFLPTNDLMFRRMLTGFAHPELLAGLITDLSGYQVRPEQIRLLSTESVSPEQFFRMPEGEQRRLAITRRDVTVEIIPADVTIEMQVVSDPLFVARALYYQSAVYAERYGALAPDSSKFAGLRPVWSLNILKHRMFDDEEAFRIFALRNERTGEFLIGRPFETWPLRIGFFEIPKQLEKADNDTTPEATNQLAWALFFQTGIAPTWAPNYIKKAAELVNLVNTNPKEAAMLTKQQQFIDDLESAIRPQAYAEGQAAGHAAGRAEGKTEGLLEVAKTSLTQGIDEMMVSRITGLPLDQIRALSKEPQLSAK